MRLPSGYGQIVKLSGKRRRPYAVRIETGSVEDRPGHFVRRVEYLGYFEKRSDAMDFLAKYNAGIEIEKAPPIVSLPTFADVYAGFMEYYQAKHPDASRSALVAYSSAYSNASALHAMKFASIRLDNLQSVITANSKRSKSTIANLIKLFHGMYKYAGMNDLCDKDYSQYVFNSGSTSEAPAHTPFSDSEISRLWEAAGNNNPLAPAVLVLIYSGVRIEEFLGMEAANVDISAQIMRGGVKTKAGKGRIIPIHNATLPFVKSMMELGGKYMFTSGGKMTYRTFVDHRWEPLMKSLGMEHTPHDTRHTATTLMERYEIPLLHRKLILGHAIRDITEGVYTHVEPLELVRDINTIPVITF